MPGTTTNFGWSYPVNTDPLADGAQEIQNFADAADTDLGDLLGGTTDQLLAKNSNTNMDFKWVTPPGSYGIPFVSGNYYEGPGVAGYGSETVTEDVTYYFPFYVPTATTFDRIAVRTSSAHTGTSTIRLGLYTMGVGVPTTVILDAGTVSATAASTTYAITINQTINPGWIWTAANVQTRTGVQSLATIGPSTGAIAFPGLFRPVFGSGFSEITIGYTESGVTGAFATAATLTGVSETVVVGLRKA